MINKARAKRYLKKILAPLYRIKLKNNDFSIISNNCWGGAIYDRYNLPYRTPTIGLWIPPKDYIRFIKNLEFYFSQDIIEIAWSKSHVRDILEERKARGRYSKSLDEFIIGRIVDVDIVFLHYDSFKDAREKWNRRKARVNYDNLIIKFNDQNGADREDAEVFLNTDFKNKLYFTASKDMESMDNVIYLSEYADVGYVKDDINATFKKMNITEYLNGLKN